MNIVIIGGGAAGFFAALRAAEIVQTMQQNINVIILESTSSVLKKVRISGGGRCNVTHNCFEVQMFCKNYPRGAKELISPFQQFQARDTVKWFLQRQVQLITEDDGRMFPNTHSSETIIECFLHEMQRLKVQLLFHHAVQNIEQLPDETFLLHFKDKPAIKAHRLLIATGSASAGYTLAQSLGHSITELAPSLFSFKINDALLKDLSGLSFPHTQLKLRVGQSTFKQQGPCLITHWGLSGPAILKLSAWAAREMLQAEYKATLFVNWLGCNKQEEVYEQLIDLKNSQGKSLVKNSHPQALAKRFWQQLVEVAVISPETIWYDLSKKQLQKLAELLFAYPFEILGKNRYKEEFVECGGVSLKEIDFKTMQSKICKHLYFAGEILDIDGITGGFNFQNAWTTGFIAGTQMAKSMAESTT